MTSNWIATAKERTTIPQVAELLGMKTKRMNSYSPCPSCGRDRRGGSDPRGPIGVAQDSRGWRCHRCGAGGDCVDLVALSVCNATFRDCSSSDKSTVKSWFERAGILGGATAKTPVVKASKARNPKQSRVADPVAEGSSGGPFGWTPNLVMDAHARLIGNDGKPDQCRSDVWAWLNYRRISYEAVQHWSLGAVEIRGKPWLVIPLRDDLGKIVSARYRSIPTQDEPNRKKEYRVCTGRPLPLFGAHTLSGDLDTPVLIVEGELDVIAAWQYGIRSCVVSGTGGAATFKDEWLDLLETYRSFIIMYDDDKAGDDGAEALSLKLGRYRTARSRLHRNDLGECLIADDDVSLVERALDRSEPMFGVSIRRPTSYQDRVEELITRPDLLRGRTTGSTKLDNILGGIRPGLWVVTGDTGHGKTTWATWLLHEQAKSGIPVLLTSFEQSPVGTVQKLIRAEVGGDFTSCSQQDRVDAFQRLDSQPLYILDHYGEATFEDVRDAIRYSIRRHGVSIALVDHLGFLARGSADGERQRIEEIVRALATIAVQDEITIVLIAHPNRLSKSQQRRVQLTDLKGASAIEQDTHVGIVVERLNPSKDRRFPATVIHLDKVRSEFGSPGSRAVLAYDPIACVYADQWEATPAGSQGKTVVVPA